MSFGLGISFGRLCRRQWSLEDVYAAAPMIPLPEPRENPIETDPVLEAAFMRIRGQQIKRARFIIKSTEDL